MNVSRSARLGAVVVACLALFAISCSSGSQQPNAPPVASNWFVVRDDRQGSPLHAYPSTPPAPTLTAGMAPEKAAMALLVAERALFGFDDPTRELVFVRTASGATARGAMFVVFAQVERGVPVFTGGASVGFDAGGRARYVNAGYVAGLSTMSTTPVVSGAAAVAAALKDVAVRFPATANATPSPTPTPTLAIVPVAGTPIRARTPGVLAYRFGVAFEGMPTTVDLTYTVDASTAKVLMVRRAFFDQAAGASFVQATGAGALKDVKSFAAAQLNGVDYMQQLDPVRSPPAWVLSESAATGGGPPVRAEVAALSANGPWDASSVDAYVYTNEAAAWWGNRGVSIYGLTGNTPLKLLVHAGNIQDGLEYRGSENTIAVGQPSRNPYAWSVALDGMGHEYTHGITEHLLALGNGNEVEAVNESLADVVGQFVEADSPKAYANATPNLVGEAMGVSLFRRDIAEPHFSPSPQPDNVYDVSPAYVLTDVHTLDGIPNNAWYLASFGGTNLTSLVNVPAATALSWSDSEALYALFIKSGAMVGSIGDLGRGLVGTATTYFPSVATTPSTQVSQIACAFYAVGVLTPEDLRKNGVVDCPCRDRAAGTYCGTTSPDDLKADAGYLFGTSGTLYTCEDPTGLVSAMVCPRSCSLGTDGMGHCDQDDDGGANGSSHGSSMGCTGHPGGGSFCGSDGMTLTTCDATGHATGSQTCATGCQSTGAGADGCNSDCASQGGTFCGGRGGMPGDPGMLYQCVGGSASSVGACPSGCKTNGSGNDACDADPGPCTGQPAGDVCSADGASLYACDGAGNAKGTPKACGGCIVVGGGGDVCLPPKGTPGGWLGSGDHGGSTGGPHDVTFDGLLYDFQAVGEFVLVSDGSAYVVQVRQQPFNKSASIATNVAAAAQVGADRVGFYAGATASLRINGAPAQISAAVTLPGGGTVAPAGAGRYLVTWPSGDQLGVRFWSDHLDVYPVVAGGTSRALVGLLGNDNGTFDDDLALRGGGPLARPVRFADLYPGYADSWRITQAESLFDYGPGETTATFTNRSFPAARVSAASLSPSDFATAHETCAAAVSTPLVPACMLDLGEGEALPAPSYGDVPTPRATLSTAYYSTDFESPVGAEWSSTTISQAAGSASYSTTRYLGPADVDAVTLTLMKAPAHDTIALAFDLYVMGPWTGTNGGDAGAAQAVTVKSRGATLLDASFSNGAGMQSYPDDLGTGPSHPAGAGAVATDAVGAGTTAAAFAVYHATYTFADVSTGGAVAITFAASGLTAGGGATWGIDNVEVDLASAPTTTAGGVTFVHGPAGDPATVGCADGTREAFLDALSHPKIAGCMATWSAAANMRAPATGAPCGDGIGPCASPADACGRGWHVCGAGGAVAELRAYPAAACENAGNGMFIAAISHCQSQDTCLYDTTATATYPCYASGYCSESVCCGSECKREGICADGVWTGATHITPSESNGCGATVAPAAGGVLCCSP